MPPSLRYLISTLSSAPLCSLWLILLICGTARAQRDIPDDPTVPKSVAPADAPPALKEYKGRTIALTMHYAGADWLTRNEREKEERATRMLSALKLQPGQYVCDMGCGNGFHTLPIARTVGDKGRVYAVDIQREMLLLLKQRAKKEELARVELVHSLLHDPKLPEGKLDLVLLVDVYHEFSHPEHMLKAIRRSLKPEGRVALVEFRAEDENVPIKPEHKMTKAQILKEFPPNGFALVEEYEKLPWQHLMFFARDDSPLVKKGAPAKDAKPTESKPTDSKPADNKPTDTKPANATPKQKIDRERGVTYIERDGKPLRAEVYVPQGDEPKPGVLVIHGGAWRMGSRYQLAGVAEKLAAQGFVAVAIDYRLAPASKFPAQIEDCKEAVRWMRRQAARWKLDPDRLAAYGYSAGGHLAALLGTTEATDGLEGLSADQLAGNKTNGDKPPSTRVQCVIAGGAPCDFRLLPRGSNYLSFWLGGTRGDLPEVYRRASPATFVTRDDPPMFFFHGENDQLVPLASPKEMVAALQKANVKAELLTLPNREHILACFDEDALAASTKFLQTNLAKPAMGK